MYLPYFFHPDPTVKRRSGFLTPSFKNVKSLGASLTGFTLYIFTIYAAIYGFIFFDEKLESFHYLGTVLVFIGVYLAKKNYETKT